MKKNKKSINYGKWGYLFILPFFIIYLIFSLIPLVDTVRYSFFEYFRSGIKEIGPNFIGMANYISLLKSSELSTLFRPFNLRDLRITLFNSSLKVCLCFIKVNISLEIITEGVLDKLFTNTKSGMAEAATDDANFSSEFLGGQN